MATEAKETSFRSLVMHLFHLLVASAIFHCLESDKVHFVDLFKMWCLIHNEVLLNIPFTIVFIFLAWLCTLCHIIGFVEDTLFLVWLVLRTSLPRG